MSRYIDADALRKELIEIKEQAEDRLNKVEPNNIACRLIYTTQLNERDNLLSLVNWMPTADVVAIVHGYNKLFDYPSLFECSVCGWEDSDTYTGDTSKYNYCPNCGAKMDRERKEK